MKVTKYQNIYKDDKNRFILKISHKGKIKTKTLYVKTLKEAVYELERFKKVVDTPQLNEYFYNYIELVSKTQSPHEIVNKVKFYEKHYKKDFGHLYLVEITPDMLQKFANKLLDNLKPKTVKNILNILQTLYNRAIKHNILTFNPVKAVELPKFDNQRYFYLEEDEIKNFINAILTFENPLYRGIFIFLLHGRRLNEVLTLTWEDVDLKRRIYTIPAYKNKARKNMSYKMTDILFDVIVDRIDTKTSNQDYIFKSPVTGKKLQSLKRPWKKILQSANIKEMRIHDIRHLIGFYCVNYLNLPIEHISYTLGHTDIKTTQRYINHKPEIAKNTIDSFLGVFQ